tara:strand:- start:953 stop:1180 length:228 start_codon:yes stop_codon:yes gene_type:complete
MSKEYKWLVQTAWIDLNAICTPDDSTERWCESEFDTLVEAEKFMMLYQLSHTGHEITLFTPEAQLAWDQERGIEQ